MISQTVKTKINSYSKTNKFYYFYQIFLFFIVLIFSTNIYAKWSVSTTNLQAAQITKLKEKFKDLEKNKFSYLEIDEMIRQLHQLNDIDQVVVEEIDSNTVKFEVIQAKRIGKVQIIGQRALSESEVRSYFNQKTADLFDQNSLIDSGEKLRQAYKELGFLNAIIQLSEPPDAKGNIDLVIEIQEGQKTLIDKIEFESESTELNERLSKKLKSYINDPFTDAALVDIQQKLKSLLNKEARIRTEIQGPNINFNSDETRASLNFKLSNIDTYVLYYSGNKSFSSSDLDYLLDFENYNSTNPNISQELSLRIKNYYLKKGYARVEIATQESEGSKPFVKRVSFEIQEGSRIRIDKMVFNGRYSKTTEYYEKFLRKNSGDMIGQGYFNREDLEQGLNNLMIDLRNRGYLLAKLVSTRSQYNRNKDKVTVYINFDEGPLTRLQKITFDGNRSFSDTQLIEQLSLEVGGPLKLNEIEASLNKLKTFYRENGFIEMLILNELEDLVEYSDNNTLASINFKIFEGPQVRVGSIVLDGNDFTKDYVLLHELDLNVGEIVTPSKIEESVARLQRTGHFNSVEIKTLEEKTNVIYRTLIVRVSERNPGIFSMGFGATNERNLTLRGFTGIAYSNLRGTGRGVSLRLEGNYNVTDIKYLESKITLGYLEPYLFDTRVRGRVSHVRSKLVTDYDLRQVTEVAQTTYSVEKDFTSHILGIWELWSLATLHDFGIDDKIYVQETTTDIATTGPTLEVDFRDNVYNASEGTLTQVSVEYGTPKLGSTRTIEYWKTTGSFTHYYNISQKKWVWANALRAGFLENLSPLTEGGVPFDKKGFILGGRSTIRGFEAGTSEVFPNRQDLGSDRYIMSTRSQMYLIKSELRFPIYGNFSGAVFYDGGSVRIQGLEFNDFYRDAAGFGFRYNTPVGPLNLEWGWKLDRRGNEEPWRFHLSFGTF